MQNFAHYAQNLRYLAPSFNAGIQHFAFKTGTYSEYGNGILLAKL
jgi:hypothetical protein